MAGGGGVSMVRETAGRTLVAERDALGVYLEALLREPATETVMAETETAVAAVMPVPALSREEARPAWSEGSFQALLFRVAGLTLAVPLVELSGVQEWGSGRVTPMPGHVAWYLGLTLYREHNVPVVDTAQLVLPEDKLATLPPWEERLRHVVFIGEGKWGLACDELAQVITLQPEEVRWRSERTRRRWLAGTVISHMCALLDPPVFADVLATGLADQPAGNAMTE